MVETRPFLAYFENKECTLRIFKLKRDNPVNIGRVSETIILWAKNITGNKLINVRIIVTDKEVTVLPSTFEKLKADEIVKVTFVWRPKLGRRTALKTKLKSFATEVIESR